MSLRPTPRWSFSRVDSAAEQRQPQVADSAAEPGSAVARVSSVSASSRRTGLRRLGLLTGAAVGLALLQPGLALASGAGVAKTAAPVDDAAAATAMVAWHDRDPGTYYVPPPDRGALTQIAALLHRHQRDDAARIAAMVTTPQAVWLTGGTPAQVREQTRKTVHAAAEQHKIPVLVAYNLPFRDCAQYSSGGAKNTADYLAWIGGVAAGIGKNKAVVLVEPDGLGIIPFYQPLYGSMDWCQPRDAAGNPQPGATPADRFAALNGAVDKLAALPGADVYLDGTNSAWLNTGEITDRLLKAGVKRADGFFLNVSNYRTTSDSNHYGGWISDCLAASTAGASWAIGHPGYCPGPYLNGVMDYSPAHVAEVDAKFVDMLAGAKPTTRYLVDTSRSGRGPNDMSAYAAAPYNQPASVVSALRAANWCNPPGAGAGDRPTSKTGVPLAAAYLWVKTPGQSDGSCDSAGGARAWDYSAYNPWKITDPAAQSHFDPLWGMVDPAAGAWFPQQALELARLAQPALPTHR